MGRIKHLIDHIDLIAGSLESFPSIYKAVRQTRPDEVYHLAAQSYVSYSFDDEFSTLRGCPKISWMCRAQIQVRLS